MSPELMSPGSPGSPGMSRGSDRWVSIALSVLLHGALLAALVYGWLLFRHPPRPTPQLAIEARVVDARTVRGALVPPPPQPTPPAAAAQPEPPAESLVPPQPTPEELAQREQQRAQAEAAAAAAEKAAAEKAAADKAAAEKAAAEKAAAEQAAKAAEEKRQAEARAAAERKAREAEEATQRAAQAQQHEADLADLRRSLAAEEQRSTARSGPAMASWESQIAAKINRAWIRPPTARPGIECALEVTQVPGGTVTKVSIGTCNGDEAVRQSIEAAVYRASPLPPPPDPSMFEPDLHINFRPD
jgi:colicin import membrane protein